MSFGTRCGLIVMLAGLAMSASAQDRPAGTWKDPPVQGSASPKKAEPVDRTAERARSNDVSARPRAGGRVAASKKKVRQASRGAAKDVRRTREVAPLRNPMPSRRMAARAHPHRQIGARVAPDFEESYVPVPRHPLARLRREGWGNLLASRRTHRLVDSDEHQPDFGFPVDWHSRIAMPDFGEDATTE